MSTASIAPGKTKTITVSWRAARGAHTVTSVVDPKNVIGESNESDNRLQKTITI